MAKELNEYQVRLTFDANTEKAKKQLKDLQQQLQSLATGSGAEKLNFSDEIAKASKAAAELSAHLSQATNMKTGTLDFTRLNDSIKKSGQSLANYGEQLLKLGPSGQQAFQKLATAVSNSEIPVRRISNTLREMGTVLKNTIKWQISSSAIHSFMGAVQSAYGYAQDLNQSLNNIRIVTGQNIEQMERFAATANKAAKALSASTLDYTDAALIYYQQGLSDEEVKARTDVTVKMANVTGETAEKVSQQLTAVWNNFAKGADNLEYFADVMTALGAATASSTDEISAGLEKFSAVAETVGLSYEYATAALATVTATTRQSADVVGNAFKTIFARLEGLKLGETLEDDTDLNKYSAALHNVGVEIKNTDGSLKDMDTILDELSSKWQTLSRDQQMALAQTVAGVRQYNTLISLMNNWDFMQENLETARNASGELQKQQDVYAQSWEAAQKRVQAAAEAIYKSLINDQFFITMSNVLEQILGTVNELIKSLGGLPGVLSVMAALVTRIFQKEMVQGLQNLTYNMKTLTEKGRQRLREERRAEIDELLDMPNKALGMPATKQEEAGNRILGEKVRLQALFNEHAHEYNQIELQTNQLLIEQLDNTQKLLEEKGRLADEAQKELNSNYQPLRDDIAGISQNPYQQAEAFNPNLKDFTKDMFGKDQWRRATKARRSDMMREAQAEIDAINEEINKTNASLESLFEATRKNALNLLSEMRANQETSGFLGKFIKDLAEAGDNSEITKKIIHQLKDEIDKQPNNTLLQKLKLQLEAVGDNAEKVRSTIRQFKKDLDDEVKTTYIPKITQQLQELGLNGADYSAEQIQKLALAMQNAARTGADFNLSQELIKLQAEKTAQTLEQVHLNYANWQSTLVNSAQAVTSISSVFNMFYGSFSNLTNMIKDGTFSIQGLVSVLGSWGMAIPTILNLVKTLNTQIELQRNKTLLNTLAKIPEIEASKRQAAAEALVAAQKQKGSKLTEQEIRSTLAGIGVKNADTMSINSNTIATNVNAAAVRAHPIGFIIGILAAVVGAVVAITSAIADNTSELEKNEKILNGLTSHYNELNNSVQSLQDSWTKLNDANKTLENLEKNTTEWKKAVVEVNEQVLELIKNYPGLAQYFSNNNGIFTISQEGYDKFLEQQQQQILMAQNTSLMAQKNNAFLKTEQISAQQSQDLVNLTSKQNYASSLKVSKEDIYSLDNEDSFASRVNQYLTNGSSQSPEEFVNAFLEEVYAEDSNELTKDFKQGLVDYIHNIGSNINPELVALEAQQRALSQGYASNLLANNKQYNAGSQGQKNLQLAFVSDQVLAADTGNWSRDYQTNYVIDNGQLKQVNGTYSANTELLRRLAMDRLGYTESEVADISDDQLRYALNSLDFQNNLSGQSLPQLKQGSLLDAALSGSIDYMIEQGLSKESLTKRFENGYFLNQLIKTYGLDPETAANILTQAKESLEKNDFSDIVPIDRIQSDFATLKKEFSSLKLGDAIDPKKFKTIPENLQSYFTLMEDGTYKLTTDAQQFHDSLFRESISSNLTNIKNFQADVDKYRTAGVEGNITEEQWATYQQNIDSVLLAADSLIQLRTARQSLIDLGVEEERIEFGLNQALQDLATKYDTCSTELEKFQIALSNGSEESIQSARGILEYSIRTAELAETMKLSVDDIEDQAEAFQNTYSALEDQQNTATRMAVLNQSMNKGIKTLTDNWTKWKETLDTTSQDSMDYIDTIQAMESALKDLVGVLEGVEIPNNFFTDAEKGAERISLMGEAASGSAEAVNRLGIELAKATFEGISSNDILNDVALDDGSMFNTSAFETWKDTILNGISTMEDAIISGQDLVGQSLTDILGTDAQNWVDALNRMAVATGMSVDQMQSTLNSLGLEANVTLEHVKTKHQVPRYKTITRTTGASAVPGVILPGGQGVSEQTSWTTTTVDGYDTVDGYVDVAQIGVGEAAGEPTINEITYAGRSTPSLSSTTSSSKGGGGGKGSGTPKKENKETKEDRYHVEEDRLDNLSKAYDRLEKAKSHAYGPDKLKYIQQEIDLLDDEIAAQEALATETEKYLEQDVSQLNYGKKNAFYLDGVAYDQRGLDFYGLTAQIDQFGAIANYNEIMAAGLEKYNAAVDEYNTAGSAHYQDDNFLKYEKEQWQGLQDLVSQTEKTIDKNYEEITEYQEKIRQQNTLRMEKITSHLELHIELNARDLKEVEYQLSKLGDDVYKTGEVAALLWSQSSDSKASLAVENIERYQSAYNELNTLLAAGQVNQDEYYEEIQKISDGLYEELGNIQDLNETAKTYYSDTLQKMGEKISWFTDRLAHNNTVLEHMKNIYMSLTQEDDFTSIGKFIDASLSHAEKELEVAKATTDAYKEQKEARQLDFDEAKRLYEEALASGDENAIEAARNGLTIAENELKAITEAFEEAEEKELEKFNQVISLMIEKVKNTIQQGYQDIEKTYTNGLGWDAINQQMSLAEKLGDKYLTKTNQAYEMSKLISQVNKDIDKTNNSNSKIRLRNFTIELENLKNTNQLSKNSLAIEQAKYEVLKAELALEEARDAKSTVRLQRDNEGNFGYVYTADRDNISDAEANLAQKQSDLYNLSLQQANDNAKELIQITQEKYNALRELDLKYATDQTNPVYLEQRVALEKYFDDLILANTKDHLIASQILQDTSITQENDSWSKEWEDLAKKHYEYITASDNFWTTNFANVTGKTQDFFNTNNPLWDAFYSGIMSNAQTTQEKVTSEMELMKTKNLPVLQLLADTIGDASLEGSLVNRYGSLETALGKIEAADKLVLATLLDGEGDEKGLITSLKEQATAASDATAEWQKWYTALLQEGGAVEAAQAINTEIQTMLEELAQIEDKEYTITKHEKTVYDAPVGSPTGTSYATPPASVKTGNDDGSTNGTLNNFKGDNVNNKNNQSPYKLIMYSSSGYPTTKYFDNLNRAHTFMEQQDLSLGERGTLFKFQNGKYEFYESLEEYLKKAFSGLSSANGSSKSNTGVAFDTGGYTGFWGPEGKIAMLHEKELVLNADDTKNFLASVAILRDITDAIDLQALSMSAAAGVALPSLGNQAQALEQTVTITAEFPNVSNHLEIEEAFNNLVNRASQYANRY